MENQENQSPNIENTENKSLEVNKIEEIPAQTEGRNFFPKN